MAEGSLNAPETERLLKGDYLKYNTNKTEEPIKVYKRRWYILAVYAALNVVSMFYTNTLPPIQEPVKLIFHWKDWNILLFNALAMISLIISAPPLAWLAVSKGLRPVVLLAASFMLVGKALQSLPFINDTVDTLLMNVGQLISSLSFGVCVGAPTLVSSIWFPPDERTTATAVGILSVSVGVATGFTVGPVFVPYSDPKLHNGSVSNAHLVLLGRHFKELMYLQAALGLAVFVAVLAYFPNKPPLPPSHSTTKKRHHHQTLKLSLSRMFRNRSFWVLASLFALEFGVVLSWQSVLALVLSKFGISQQTASFLGCGACLAGIVSGLFVSRIADYYNRSKKTILILLFAGSALFITVFSLTCEGIIPFSMPLLYVTCISSYMLVVDANPLLLELAVESTYPVPEVLSAGFMSLCSSGVSLVLLIVFILPNMNVRWMNWVFVGSVGVCVPGLLLFRAKYGRLDIDTASN